MRLPLFNLLMNRLEHPRHEQDRFLSSVYELFLGTLTVVIVVGFVFSGLVHTAVIEDHIDAAAASTSAAP
ncbi:MAG: hypothetical protein NTZ90_08140 [Proteobacteria bacterium]|nr:hypothetical protein [Pseudomonadota bacterium]